MPLPVEFGIGTVEGTYVDLSGTPMQGIVQFTASPPVLVAATSEVIIVPIQLSATLDGSGRFSIQLPATNDTDITPINWTYTVREVFSGFVRAYSIEVPLGSNVDLSTVVSVPENTGATIVRGPQGDPGPAGPTGTQGSVGPTGAMGPQGPQGAAGVGVSIQGDLAAPGDLPTTGSPGDAYLISGDLYVWSANTSAWVNEGPLQGPAGPAGIQGPTGAQGPQGDPGATGAPGTGFTYQGAWMTATNYAARDVVSYQGSTYVVTTAHTSPSTPPSPSSPGANLALWAQKGDVGAQGPTGPQGDVGPPGTPSDASTTAKGIVQLAGDLAGTASVPTVPGLTSAVGRISALETTVNTEATAVATANKLAKRDASGRMGAADPSANTDVVNLQTMNASASSLIPTTQKGAASGVAALDAGQRILMPNGMEITPVGAPANPAAGLIRWYIDSTDNGVKWRDSAGLVRRSTADLGSGTTLPASGRLRGDVFQHTGIGCTFHYTGSAWRQSEIVQVSNASARNNISTTYSAALYEGFRVAQTDDHSQAVWDGTAWMIYDTAWQTYTPSVNTSAYNTVWTQGAGLLEGRYFRTGRHIRDRGLFSIGTGTVFNSAAGSVFVGFPAGYVPVADAVSGGVPYPMGTCLVSGGSGAVFGWTALNGGPSFSTTAAQRRKAFFNGATPTSAVTSASGAWGVSASGQYVTWDASYETAFEA